MSSFWKLSYVVVVDDNEDGEDCAVGEVCHQHHPNFSFSYTLANLQSVLQLAGCKMSHAFKISRRVFDILENEHTQRALRSSVKECSTTSANMLASKAWNNSQNVKLKEPSVEIPECVDSNLSNKSGLFDLYKRQAMVTVKRKKFLDVICSSLTEYHYVGPSQRSDIVLASRIREKKDSVTILLCGTSGCGKSTLSSLLAGRLGITTVVSTDSIRHMMRSFADEKENPLLWASTYHAGEHLDPASVAQAKSKKKDGQSISTPAIGSKIMAIEGYKAQSEMVIDSLDKLITAWEGHKESVIVEGVHLSLNFVMGLMRKHPSIIPFLIYIADEEKHLERFAVRAKYMTLDPKKNKYVKYISNIRTIQDYLCKRADKHLVPKVNNTNVDRSVASIHATIFSCLRKRQTGVGLYDMATNTVKVVSDEYHKHCDTNSVSSKCMFKIIQRQGSSRRLMAIINSDGTVSKAWPFSTEDDIGLCQSNITTVGTALYGPLQIGLSEPVNVQFGNFGIGSWLNSIEGTSCTSSINGSRADGDDSTRYSSCSSSPPHSDGHAKDLIEDDLVVAESEEELFLDTEDSGSDKTEELGEDDLDGSVVESDEELEYDGFAVDMNHLSVYDKSERTLSRTASSRRQDHEHRAYNRSVSLPATKNPSARIKKAKTFKISLDENRDTTN